jgi:hemolysin D
MPIRNDRSRGRLARVIAVLLLAAALFRLGFDLRVMLLEQRIGLATLGDVLGPEVWTRLAADIAPGRERATEILTTLETTPACLITVALAGLVLILDWIIRGLYHLGSAFVLPPSEASREELQFLPAALEIVESPPSPIGRAIAATIIAVFCVALGWAVLGHVDIIASASGKVVPTGRTKIIQPFETGVIRAIHVRDGQRVKAGETLIELDSTMNTAERDHLKSDLLAARLETTRLRAAIAENPEAAFEPPAGAAPALVAMQRQYLAAQVAEQKAKLSALDRQRVQKLAETATIAATIAKLRATTPLIQERVTIRQSLKEYGTRLNYLETVQLLTENIEDLKVEKARLNESEAALATIDETRKEAVEEYRRARYAELTEAERKAAGLAEDLVKAEERTRLQLLKAPVDGTVQQLAVHTVGGVVTPAQGLLVLVPAESHLEIEAMVANRDIGFVQAGQEAEIKVDTFNFTRYGLLHGRVLSVSSDAISREGSSDKPGDREASGDAKVVGPFYAAHIALDRSAMQIDDRLVNLAPGMTVTAEINTGSRRLISYLLSPLAKYSHESLRER